MPGRLSAGRLIRQREFAQKPSALCPGGQASGTLISRTWFRILGWWLRRTMSCSAVGRGHRRSWSWPGTAPRICCAGSSTSGTDPGTPGCPGSNPPGIRSGTVITWSASAPMRCGAWRIPRRTRRYRAGCSAATGRSAPGPRPHPARQTLTVPGTMARPDASTDDSRPSSGAPDTDGVPQMDGVPVRPAGGPVGPEFPDKPRASGRKPTAGFHCRRHFGRCRRPYI